MPVKPQERQITSCRARAGQHASSSHKHCKPCAKHTYAPRPRARACLCGSHRVEKLNQPVYMNIKLKPQCDGAGETSRTKNASCRERAGQHANPTHKHCKACANHAHAPWPRARTSLHDFHLVKFSYQPRLSQ